MVSSPRTGDVSGKSLIIALRQEYLRTGSDGSLYPVLKRLGHPIVSPSRRWSASSSKITYRALSGSSMQDVRVPRSMRKSRRCTTKEQETCSSPRPLRPPDPHRERQRRGCGCHHRRLHQRCARDHRILRAPTATSRWPRCCGKRVSRTLALALLERPTSTPLRHGERSWHGASLLIGAHPSPLSARWAF